MSATGIMPGEKVNRPLVRWHGGKWKLAPWIIKHLPAHRVYVEPFGGGGSVLLRKIPSYAEVYNDLDGEIVNLFRVTRDRGDELRRVLELTPFAREEFKEAHLPTDDPLERARRLVVVCFQGFGSNAHMMRTTGFRSNSNRSGSTPSHDWRNYPDKLVKIIERLRGVVIEHREAVHVMTQHDGPETLHYVDPPYLAETRGPGRDYTHEFTDDQHVALAGFLDSLRGAVVLSGYPSALYDRLYASWKRVECEALADGARKRTEVLWIRHAPPAPPVPPKGES